MGYGGDGSGAGGGEDPMARLRMYAVMVKGKVEAAIDMLEEDVMAWAVADEEATVGEYRGRGRLQAAEGWRFAGWH